MAYWICTVLLALELLFGGVGDLLHAHVYLQILAHLGYPAYLANIIGTWKVAAAVAIVVPGFARLKEWAYAGSFFEMTGAAASHAFKGDGVVLIIVPTLFAILTVASWALRPSNRRLPSGTASHSAPI